MSAKILLHIYPNHEGHLQPLMVSHFGNTHTLGRDLKVHILGMLAQSRKGARVQYTLSISVSGPLAGHCSAAPGRWHDHNYMRIV